MTTMYIDSECYLSIEGHVHTYQIRGQPLDPSGFSRSRGPPRISKLDFLSLRACRHSDLRFFLKVYTYTLSAIFTLASCLKFNSSVLFPLNMLPAPLTLFSSVDPKIPSRS